jgi:hypothetical protein
MAISHKLNGERNLFVVLFKKRGLVMQAGIYKAGDHLVGTLVILQELRIPVESGEHVSLLFKERPHVFHMTFGHHGRFQQPIVRVIIHESIEFRTIKLKHRNRREKGRIRHLAGSIRPVSQPHRCSQDLDNPVVRPVCPARARKQAIAPSMELPLELP